MRIVFMGTPDFAAYQLEKIHQSPHQVVGVVTVADKPAGRGRKVHSSAVKQKAEKLGIPVLQPTQLRNEAFLSELAAWEAEVFVVVAFRMLPKVVWSMPAKGTFNLHASLLPQYRGAAPINWAIVNQEKQSGVSTFLIDEKIDTGALLLQKSIDLLPDETAGSLHDRLMVLGAEVILQTLDGLANNALTPEVQEENESDLKAAPKIFKENSEIQPHWSAEEIDAFVRGMFPYPTAWLSIEKDGESMEAKILEGKVREAQGKNEPELRIHAQALELLTSKGIYEILQLKVPGKRAMSAKDLLNGWGKNTAISLKKTAG